MQRIPLGQSLMMGVALFLAMVLVAAAIYWMRRAGVERAGRIAALFASALGAWLVAVCALSVNGWLSQWNALPPRIPLLAGMAIAAYTVVASTRIAKSVLEVAPLWLPIALQSFRLVVEIALWLMHREGSVPIQFTIEGRNVDMLVGMTAPLVAWGVANRWMGTRGIAVWNGLGMVLLLHAMATAATSSPGPQHLDWPGEPFTAIATWPLVWLPTFLAPTAVFLHLLSLRQTFSAVWSRRR